MKYNVTAPDGFDPLTGQLLVTAPDGFDSLTNQCLVTAPQTCETCAEPNLFPNPIDMTASPAWSTPGSTVITANAAESPDCTNNANYVSLTAGDSPSQGLFFDVSTGNPSIELSVWIKKITPTITSLRLAQSINQINGRWDVNFSLLGDGWEKISKDHPAVTEINAWQLTDGDLWIDMEHDAGTSPIEFYAWCWNAVEI